MEFGLLKFVNNKFLADCTLKVEENTYKVHKVVLAAASAYYYRIFENENKSEVPFPPYLEPKFSNLPIKDIFESVLKYIYSDQDCEILNDNINDQTANTYLAVSYSLGIESLIELSSDYIISHILSPDNSVDYLTEGIRYYSEVLQKAALSQVLLNFQLITKEEKNLEKLISLPLKIVTQIISDDNLKVDSEKVVYDFICNYVFPSVQTERKNVTEQEALELFGKIRWPFLSHSELLEAASNQKIIICKDLVLEGLSVQLAEHNKPKDYVYKVIRTPRNSYTNSLLTNNPKSKSQKNVEMPIRFLAKSQNNWKSYSKNFSESSYPRAPQEISKFSRRLDK